MKKITEKTIRQTKTFFRWLFSIGTIFLFVKIAIDLGEVGGTSKTKFLIGLIFFGWCALMLKK